MKNLLPKKYKDKVNKEYNLRILIVSVWLMFSLFCVGVLLILPSFFIIQTQVSALHERESLIERTIEIRKKYVSVEEIKNTKLIIEKLKKEKEEVSLRQVLIEIDKTTLSGIKIDSLNYASFVEDVEEEKTEKGKLKVRGIASDRDTLIDFSENLKTIKGIFSSKLPTSQLAKSRDIPFLIEMEVDF